MYHFFLVHSFTFCLATVLGGTNGWETVLAFHPAKVFCPSGRAIFGPAIVLGGSNGWRCSNLLTGGPAQIAIFFAYFSVSKEKNIKRSPNGMKPSGT